MENTDYKYPMFIDGMYWSPEKNMKNLYKRELLSNEQIIFILTILEVGRDSSW